VYNPKTKRNETDRLARWVRA